MLDEKPYPFKIGQAVRFKESTASDSIPFKGSLGIVVEVMGAGYFAKVAWQGAGIGGVRNTLLEPVTLVATDPAEAQRKRKVETGVKFTSLAEVKSIEQGEPINTETRFAENDDGTITVHSEINLGDA